MLRRAWQEAPGNIRVMGRGHSFNDICNTDGTLINLTRRMNQVLELNADSRTLRVQGGITYTGMFEYLRDTEWALPNTASMPHFSLSGAISTGKMVIPFRFDSLQAIVLKAASTFQAYMGARAWTRFRAGHT